MGETEEADRRGRHREYDRAPRPGVAGIRVRVVGVDWYQAFSSHCVFCVLLFTELF